IQRSLLFLFSLLFSFQGLIAQKTAFTSPDILDVKSLGSLTISPDGQYVAGIMRDGRTRLDVDHFRFRDPSYIRPFSGSLVVIETATGEVWKPLEAPGHYLNPSWSDEGNQLAFWVYKEGKMQLHISDIAKEQTNTIAVKTDLSINTNGFLEWFPNGENILISLRAKDWLEKGMAMYKEATDGPTVVYDASEPFLKWDAIGNHSQQAIPTMVNLKNGSIKELLPAGRYGSFRIDGENSFIAYQETHPLKTSYNRRDGAEYEWRRLDLDSGESVTLKEKSKKRPSIIWSEDNRWMAFADSGHVMISPTLSDTIINLTKGQNELIEEGDTTEVKFSASRWNQDASKLILSSKEGRWIIDKETKALKRFMEIDPEDKKAPSLSPAFWSADDRYLYFSYAAKTEWERGLVRYDFQNDQLEDIVKNTKLYTQWRFSKNGDKVAYQRTDGDLPNDLYVSSLDFKTTKQLTDLNPWTKDKKMTKSELVTYLDADGNELSGILYYPVDYEPGKTYPLVCEIYERFFNNGYRSSMNIIANAGYFGFRPSVSLEEGYPGEAWIKGVSSGINKLIERGLVDKDKIGVHGTSYGGYAASLLIAQTDRFAAAINISGKTNMVSFLGDSPRIGTRNYAAAEVGQDRIGASLWDAPMKYINHSAIMFADRMDTPHLLLTGEGDWNVPAANTRELYYALRRLGKEVVWVNYKNAGHGAGWAGSEEDYHDQWERMLAWYDQYFNADEEEKKP
ncbi:MAG: prolyl oligopeptidase family serine peptidase, partial [Bacteroidota bacterium]